MYTWLKMVSEFNWHVETIKQQLEHICISLTNFLIRKSGQVET